MSMNPPSNQHPGAGDQPPEAATASERPDVTTPTAPPESTQPPSGAPAYASRGPGNSTGGGMPPVMGGDAIGASGPTGGGRRGWVPWVIGLVVVLVIGGGAFAVRAALGGGGDQPASALPASTIAYARIDLDPSGTQKIAALRLAQKFPDFAESTGITDAEMDLRERLWQEIQAGSDEIDDIDYATDIEPWLGSRAALGYVPVDDGASPEEGVVVALQVTDQDAAAEGLEKLMSASADTADPASSEPAGVAFAGEYALIAMTQSLADEYASAAEAGSLAEDADFRRDLAELGEEGVASFWMSNEVYRLAGEAMGDALTVSGMTLEQLQQQGNLAMALRFDESFVELAFAVTEAELPVPDSQAGGELMANLPDSTLFAMAAGYDQASIEEAWRNLAELGSAGGADAGVDFDREIEAFEQQTGLSLPGDLVTLLGEGFAFAVDGEGLDEMQNLEDPANLRIGALFQSDPAAAEEVLDKLVAALVGEFPLETVAGDGVLAVSPSPEYAAELTDGSLGDTEAFRNAVQDGDDADVALFFNMDVLEATSLFQDNVDPQVRANLEVISAIGLSGSYADGIGHGSFRVVVGG